MDRTVTGRCLCGAVTFRIMGAFEHFFLCHCGRCRKASGSAHSANLFSSTAQVTWLSGTETIKTFELPGTRHVKCFCTGCGSALPYALKPEGMLVVPAGSLDDATGLRPEAHICFASRASWDDALGALETFDGLPG